MSERVAKARRKLYAESTQQEGVEDMAALLLSVACNITFAKAAEDLDEARARTAAGYTRPMLVGKHPCAVWDAMAEAALLFKPDR